MKKKLITLENIDEYICQNEFCVSKDMIVLPRVKDYLENKKIKISYISDNEKELENRVKTILINEFAITNKKIIEKIMKKIKGELRNEY